MEVNHYLDDDLDPQDNNTGMKINDHRQYIYSAQDFSKDNSEKRISSHAHLQLE